jgi:hypothetical protein
MSFPTYVKRILLLLVLLLAPSISLAQTTTVTGVAVDANGNGYYPGTITADLQLATGQAPPSGSIIVVGPTPTTFGGNFSVVVTSNQAYTFTICAMPVTIGPLGNVAPKQVCFQSPVINIGSTSPQVITGNLTSIPLLGPAGTSGGGFVAGNQLSGSSSFQNVIGLTFGSNPFALTGGAPTSGLPCVGYISPGVIGGILCGTGSGANIQIGGISNPIQTVLNFTAGSGLGLSVNPFNPSGGIVQFNLTGILTPPGGGCGIASPTVNSIEITNGTSNCTLLTPPGAVGIYVPTVVQPTSATVAPQYLIQGVLPNIDSTVSHTFAGNTSSPTDNANVVVRTYTAGPMSDTLAAAGSAGFPTGYVVGVLVASTQQDTITSNSICDIICSTTYVVASGASIGLVNTGSAWYVLPGASSGGLSGGTAGFIPIWTSSSVQTSSLCGVASNLLFCTYANGIAAGSILGSSVADLPQSGGEFANNTSIGTSLNSLAKFDNTNPAGSSMVEATVSDTDVPVWPVNVAPNDTAGTTGQSFVVWQGLAHCIFDASTTINDWVVNSTTVGGDCHDTGTSNLSLIPGPVCLVGQAQATNGGAGTYLTSVDPFCIPGSNLQVSAGPYINVATSLVQTTLYTPAVDGAYVLTASINNTNTNVSGTDTLSIGWTDTSNTAQSISVTTTCPALGTGSYNSIIQPMNIKGGTNITFKVTPTSCNFTLHIKVNGTW